MENNEKIKKANEELEILSADEEARELAEFRESSLREMASAKNYGYSLGKEEGLKKGLKKGEEKAKKEKYEMIKSMIKENASIDFISKVTGLTKEEIVKINIIRTTEYFPVVLYTLIICFNKCT